MRLWPCAAVVMLQAGVAMGLARIAGTAFADWGPAFQTVMMSIIMINMLAGPPFFRAALIRVSSTGCTWRGGDNNWWLCCNRDSWSASS